MSHWRSSPQQSPAQQQQLRQQQPPQGQQQRPQGQQTYASAELRVDVEQYIARTTQSLAQQRIGLDMQKDAMTAPAFRQEWQDKAQQELRNKLPEMVRKINDQGGTLESKSRLLELTVSKLISRIHDQLMNQYFSEETQLASEHVLHDCEKVGDPLGVDKLRAQRDQRTYQEQPRREPPASSDPKFTNRHAQQSVQPPRQGLEDVGRSKITEAIQAIELGREHVGLDLRGGEVQEFRRLWKHETQQELTEKMPRWIRDINTKHAGHRQEEKATILELTVRKHVTQVGENLMARHYDEQTRRASDRVLHEVERAAGSRPASGAGTRSGSGTRSFRR